MTLARTESDPNVTPLRLLVMAGPALIVGVGSALILWVLDFSADSFSSVLWTTLPGMLGVDPAGWWIVLILTLTGLAVGIALQILPGHGGPDSATTELVGAPLPLKTLPGLAIVTFFALAGGVSLGPENPIIAINTAIVVAVFARLIPKVSGQIAVLLATAATVGALFGTPVAAALILTGMVAAAKSGGALWDRLFLPLVAAAAAAITMHLLGAPAFAFDLPAYSVQAIDLLTGSIVTVLGVVLGLAALAVFPLVYRAFHALRYPIVVATLGGLVLGILGFIGGPITMFKGLTQIGELLENPGQYTPGELAAMTGIKILALLVAASTMFRGGRVFPAVFIGVAFGMLVSAVFPSLPLSLMVACGVLAIVLVVARDGWLALFVAAAIGGDIAMLPVLCVAILPAWLMVSRAPEFRIVPTPVAGLASANGAGAEPQR
ncbi:ion channel protein (plasmid) [Coraliomargarita sp. W4R53]